MEQSKFWKRLTPDEKRVADILKEEARGRGNAVRVPDLARRLDFNIRRVRGIVERLISKGFPVGSHHTVGIYLMIDEEDFRLAEAEIISLARSLEGRARNLKEAYKQWWEDTIPGGQKPLFRIAGSE